MANEFTQSQKSDITPDNCRITVQFTDIPNPIPGWDSGSGEDVMESVVTGATFIVDHPDPAKAKHINVSFDESGKVVIVDLSGNELVLKVCGTIHYLNKIEL